MIPARMHRVRRFYTAVSELYKTRHRVIYSKCRDEPHVIGFVALPHYGYYCFSLHDSRRRCSWVKADYANGGIPDEVYAMANVTTAVQAAEECERIGFPVMIKASEGGGGKGIRKVTGQPDVGGMGELLIPSFLDGTPLI